jgi:hypothetical protein
MTEGIVTVKRPVARQLWLSTVSDTTTKKGCKNQFNAHIQWNGIESAVVIFGLYYCRNGYLRPSCGPSEGPSA